MAIKRMPMCKKHPRQYAHSCVDCEREFREKQLDLEFDEDHKESNRKRIEKLGKK